MSTEGKAQKGLGAGAVFAIAVVIGAIAGFGGGYAAQSLGGGAPEAQAVTIYMQALEFNGKDAFVPNTFTVVKGTMVTLKIFSVPEVYGGEIEYVDHEFHFTTAPYMAAVPSKVLTSNETVTITFEATDAGNFPFACAYHVPPSDPEGIMYGVMTVVE